MHSVTQQEKRTRSNDNNYNGNDDNNSKSQKLFTDLRIDFVSIAKGKTRITMKICPSCHPIHFIDSKFFMICTFDERILSIICYF